MNRAPPMAPMPPAAKTRPSSRADAARSFFTTYGSSTSAGPRKQRYANAAERRVPQSQERRATNRSPDFIAATADSESSLQRRAGGRIIPTAIVEAANERLSSAKDVPDPSPATSAPPRVGPTRRRAIGRTNWSREFAAGRSAEGTRSGTAASKAGVKNAVPTP